MMSLVFLAANEILLLRSLSLFFFFFFFNSNPFLPVDFLRGKQKGGFDSENFPAM